MLFLTMLALAIVLVISGLHLAWAAKFWWPIAGEKQLARAVAGFPEIDRMPSPAACFRVAFALLCVALLLLLKILQTTPHPIVTILLLGAGLVFLGRGAIGFTPFWARITPEQPFRKLDMKFYSPLCVAIGVMIVMTSMF